VKEDERSLARLLRRLKGGLLPLKEEEASLARLFTRLKLRKLPLLVLPACSPCLPSCAVVKLRKLS
jgi:hypothetical protein